MDDWEHFISHINVMCPPSDSHDYISVLYVRKKELGSLAIYWLVNIPKMLCCGY